MQDSEKGPDRPECKGAHVMVLQFCCTCWKTSYPLFREWQRWHRQDSVWQLCSRGLKKGSGADFPVGSGGRIQQHPGGEYFLDKGHIELSGSSSTGDLDGQSSCFNVKKFIQARKWQVSNDQLLSERIVLSAIVSFFALTDSSLLFTWKPLRSKKEGEETKGGWTIFFPEYQMGRVFFQPCGLKQLETAAAAAACLAFKAMSLHLPHHEMLHCCDALRKSDFYWKTLITDKTDQKLMQPSPWGDKIKTSSKARDVLFCFFSPILLQLLLTWKMQMSPLPAGQQWQWRPQVTQDKPLR